MDLRTDSPFWLLEKGLIKSYPSLDTNLTTDVAIMGAGISGALIASELSKAGVECVVVDRRHVGTGSTSATTGLLQYETDTPLTRLIDKVGLSNASRSYHLCYSAIDELATLCKTLPEAEFQRRPSLQYASFEKHVPNVAEEYALRRSIGIPVDWLDRQDIHRLFGFDQPAGILSAQGATINAYGLTHALLRRVARRGMPVYDNTAVHRIQRNGKTITLDTKDGNRIRCRRLIIACGFESGRYLPRRVDQLYTTYAAISEPLPDGPLWHRNALIWETASPYLYLRTTIDNRIIIGGKDDKFTDPRLREQAMPRKIRQLERDMARLFPQIKWKTDFYWAGSFASTRDGLPYIGALPHRKNVYFALGFGGNGIVFSRLAATILRDLIIGRSSRSADLFSFTR